MDWLQNFATDEWVKAYIVNHTILIGLLSAIGSMVTGGSVVGGVLKILAILSPTTKDNKVKTMLENLREPVPDADMDLPKGV